MRACLNLLLPLPRIATRYEDADLVTCAATYAYHLTQAHAFIDGNKRVGAAITETFLESNGSQLTMSDDEIVRLFLDIAGGMLNREDVARLLRSKTETLKR
jgi:death-on-curing protein